MSYNLVPLGRLLCDGLGRIGRYGGDKRSSRFNLALFLFHRLVAEEKDAEEVVGILLDFIRSRHHEQLR
jgi:hypothetical protein